MVLVSGLPSTVLFVPSVQHKTPVLHEAVSQISYSSPKQNSHQTFYYIYTVCNNCIYIYVISKQDLILIAFPCNLQHNLNTSSFNKPSIYIGIIQIFNTSSSSFCWTRSFIISSSSLSSSSW